MLRIQKYFRQPLLRYLFVTNPRRQRNRANKKSITIMITPKDIQVNSKFIHLTKQMTDKLVIKVSALKKGQYVLGQMLNYIVPFLEESVDTARLYKILLRVLEEVFQKNQENIMHSLHQYNGFEIYQELLQKVSISTTPQLPKYLLIFLVNYLVSAQQLLTPSATDKVIQILTKRMVFCDFTLNYIYQNYAELPEETQSQKFEYFQNICQRLRSLHSLLRAKDEKIIEIPSQYKEIFEGQVYPKYVDQYLRLLEDEHIFMQFGRMKNHDFWLMEEIMFWNMENKLKVMAIILKRMNSQNMYLYSSTFIKSILDILLKYFSHPENKQVITQFIDHVNRHFVTFHQDDLSTSLFNVCEKYSIPLRGETQKVLLSGLGQIRDADRLDQKWEIQKKKYEGLYRTYLKLKLCKKSKNCYKNEIKSSINKIKSTLSIEFPNLTGIQSFLNINNIEKERKQFSQKQVPELFYRQTGQVLWEPTFSTLRNSKVKIKNHGIILSEDELKNRSLPITPIYNSTSRLSMIVKILLQFTDLQGEQELIQELILKMNSNQTIIDIFQNNVNYPQLFTNMNILFCKLLSSPQQKSQKKTIVSLIKEEKEKYNKVFNEILYEGEVQKNQFMNIKTLFKPYIELFCKPVCYHTANLYRDNYYKSIVEGSYSKYMNNVSRLSGLVRQTLLKEKNKNKLNKKIVIESLYQDYPFIAHYCVKQKGKTYMILIQQQDQQSQPFQIKNKKYFQMLYNVVVIRNEEDLRKMVEVIFT